MKSIFKTIAVGLMIIAPQLAGSAVDNNYNLYVEKDNYNCEHGRAKWTASNAGELTHTTTALMGTGSCQWTSAASGRSFSLPLVAIPEFMRGKSCIVSYLYKLPTTSNITLEAFDGTTIVGSSRSLAVSSSAIQDSFSVTCPASGSLQIVGRSVTGATGTLTIDEIQVTVVNTAIQQASRLIGTATWATAANCDWSRNSTSFGGFSADTDCNNPSVTGLVSAPGTKVPNIVVTSLSAGDYRVCYSGEIMLFSNSINEYCQFNVTNGTVTSATVATGNDDSSDFYHQSNMCFILPGLAGGSTTFTFQTKVTTDGGTAGDCHINAGSTSISSNPVPGDVPLTVTIEKL